jgi:hypothetical protein
LSDTVASTNEHGGCGCEIATTNKNRRKKSLREKYRWKEKKTEK